MAKIEFTGFVNKWTQNNPQHPEWAMKVAEPHSKKDGEKWIPNGTTYRTVKPGYNTGLDMTRFKEGDRVTIVGRELTEVSERDGKRYENLVVKADTVQVVVNGAVSQSEPLSPTRTTQSVPEDTFDAETPF